MLRLKKALCIVLIFSIQLSIPVLGQNSRGNLTGMPQEELLDMHDLLLEQRWGSGPGIDLAAFMQIYGLSGNGLHSPGDYLNDSELNDVITSSDYLFQHQGDLINQSNSLLNQGKYNEASQVYDALLELDPIIDITRKCRCSAICIIADTVPTTPMGDDYYPSSEPKQPQTYESVMEKRQIQEQKRLKCMECEYEGDSEYSEDPRLTSLKRDMETAKAALDKLKEDENSTSAISSTVFTGSSIPNNGFGNYTFDGEDDVRVSVRKGTDVVHMMAIEEIPTEIGYTKDSAQYTVTSTGKRIKGYIDYTLDGYVIVMQPRSSLTKREFMELLDTFRRTD